LIFVLDVFPLVVYYVRVLFLIARKPTAAAAATAKQQQQQHPALDKCM